MKHIRTRISTKTRAIKAAEKVAGVTVGDLEKALTGDHAVLQKLGSMYNEGKMAAALMPAVIETVKTKIQNEKQWNKFLGEFVSEGSRAEVEIQKAKHQSAFANVSYLDNMQELKEQFKSQMELENGRYKQAIDYNRVKFFADLIIQDVEAKVRLVEQRSRIKLKQIQEDRAYELKTAQHLLENGDRSNLDLIHKRDYEATAKSPIGVLRRFRNALGI
jgi:alcohol dehydrogenase class IV